MITVSALNTLLIGVALGLAVALALLVFGFLGVVLLLAGVGTVSYQLYRRVQQRQAGEGKSDA